MRRRYAQLSEFCVLLGNRCNITCDHCGVDGHPKGSDLSEEEIDTIADVVARYCPESILFSGGEPTLYLQTIRRLTESSKRGYSPKIIITTNGHFAIDVPSAEKILSSIKHLAKVQLSYDKFHDKFIPLENVRNLYQACKNTGLKFSVVFAMQTPLDFSGIGRIAALGKFRISPIKVLPLGKAGRGGLEFRYPVFDPEVLNRRCPDRNKIVYVCGRGFSMCCASLAFGRKRQNCFFDTLEGFLSSGFRKTMRCNSFSELLNKFRIPISELRPEHSAECELCSHIFRNGIPKDAI